MRFMTINLPNVTNVLIEKTITTFMYLRCFYKILNKD